MPLYLYDWPVWIAGLLIVVVFVAFSFVSLLLVRRHFLPRVDLHGEHGQYGGVMIQSMVMLYGLVAALISVNVYNTYSEVSRIVSGEATSLASLYRDTSGYPEPTRSELRQTIRAYVQQIIHEAWPQQRHGITPTHGVEMVNAIEAELMAFEPATPHAWYPVLQLRAQVPPPWQMAVPFGSVGQATQPSPQAVASSFAAQAAPHLW